MNEPTTPPAAGRPQRCTRRLEIDAGHRLLKHEGKCRNYHGHRYVFDITCEAAALDEVGRVIDFSVIKSVVGTWLDEAWDHGMILQADDPMVPVLVGMGGLITASPKHYVVDCPPTAENLARLLHEKASQLLVGHGVVVTEVVCRETPNAWASYP